MLLLERVRGVLARAGYSDQHLQFDQTFDTGAGVVIADILAFAQSRGPYDASTATLLVALHDQPRDTYLEAARDLAIPLAVYAGPDGLDIIATDDTQTTFVPWPRAEGPFAQYLAPEVLFRQKLGHSQGALFPVDVNLLEKARQRSTQRIGPAMKELLSAATGAMLIESRSMDIGNHTKAARMVIGALTAVVIRDKSLKQQTDMRLRGGGLLDAVVQRHPDNYGWLKGLAVHEHHLLDALVDQVEKFDFTYAEPAVLSSIYESMLVEDAVRKNLGAHYTPPELADKLLQALPLEEVDPQDRRVLDPTCGSGTLLLAAHERLRSLQGDTDLVRSHDQLRMSLFGTDIDPVAVEIAKLSLLLNALPAGNGWEIRRQDALRPRRQDKFPIVVSNPPWKWSNKGSHTDLAHVHLESLLRRVAPGGYLGVILPSAWLSRTSSATSRAHLRRTCELLEVWDLPAGTFSGASSGAAAVIARRHPGRNRTQGTTVIRRVRNAAGLDKFYRTGDTDSLTIASSPTDASLVQGLLGKWWNGLDSSHSRPELDELFLLISGPQPAPQGRRATDDGSLTPNCLFLSSPGGVPRFGSVTRQHLMELHFPLDMQNGSRRGERGLGRKKVLVGASMSPTATWRLRPAVDLMGCLPRNTATMVILKSTPRNEEDVLYGLMAYLGSKFASGFIGELTRTRKIGGPQLRQLPGLLEHEYVALSSAGRAANTAANAGDAPGVAMAQNHIDDNVWKLLEVPDELRSQVESQFAGPDDARVGHDLSEYRRAGVVLEVDPIQNLLLLDIPGVTGGPELHAPPSMMPGALMRPGAAFVMQPGVESPVAGGSYEFDRVAYLDDEEVLEALSVPPLGVN